MQRPPSWLDALVYYLVLKNEEINIAYPTYFVIGIITVGRSMMCSVFSLTLGDNQGMGDVDYGMINDINFPLATAAHFAAESSTGTDVNVCPVYDFVVIIDPLVYYLVIENDEISSECKKDGSKCWTRTTLSEPSSSKSKYAIDIDNPHQV